MTNTINGWPGKPGVPLNPEKDGWHWVENKYSGDRRAALWLTDLHWGLRVLVHEMAEACIYLGPCLTPDEVQNLCDDLASAERERAHQHGRADWNAAEYAREQAKREALQKRVAELEGALDFYACVDHYQTHSAVAPVKRVLADRGAKARAALEGKKDE